MLDTKLFKGIKQGMKTGKEKLTENYYSTNANVCANCKHCFSISRDEPYFCTLNETEKPTSIPENISHNGYLSAAFKVLESKICINESMLKSGWYGDDESRVSLENKIEEQKRDLNKNMINEVVREWSWHLPEVVAYGTCDKFEHIDEKFNE